MLFKKIGLILTLLISAAFAVPASPDAHTIVTRDGSSLTLALKGDENISWYENAEGYTLLQNKNKEFVYALKTKQGELVASNMLAHDASQRGKTEKRFLKSIEPGLFYSADQVKAKKLALPETTRGSDPLVHTDFPSIGTKKLLVILASFKDVRCIQPSDEMDSLINGKNYTYNGAIGSVNQYYREASFGLFNPVFDVVGPITLDSGYATYGNNDDQYTAYQTFIKHAAQKADPYVDFADYDNDGDGEVDGIHVIFAGHGENYSGADPDLIWPHRWSYYGNLVLDGKKITDYSCSPELNGMSGETRTSIGVICHEFGHVLGLPDFYDTDYGESGGDCGGLGRWDLMAGGSYNFSGNRPPIHNAWSRMYLNWATPIELSLGDFAELGAAVTDNDVYYFTTPTDDEYFIMENRQQIGWDAGVPGHGLTVYHVDQEYGSTWGSNTLNCNPDHQAFDMEEADGQGNPSSYYTNGGDPFPGTAAVTEFSDDTTPNSLDWAGNRAELPLVNISESGGVITFNAGYEGVPDKPDTLIAGEISQNSIALNWELNAEQDTVLLIAREGSAPGRPDPYTFYETGDELTAGGTVIYKGVDTAFVHDGLKAGTDYFYSLASRNDTVLIYSQVQSLSATTSSPLFYAEDFSQGLPLGWEIKDVTGMGTWSTENLEAREFGAVSDSNGFLIMDSEHFGDVSQLQNAELITRPFNFGLSRHVVLRFQHKFVVKSVSIGTLYYTMNDGATWFQLKDWVTGTDGVESVELDITDHVSYLSNVRFKFSYRGKNEKYWCIDDMSIESSLDDGLAVNFFAVPVEGSKPLQVTFVNNTISKPSVVDSCIWNFGDDFSFDHDANFTYTRSGSFDVSLNAWNGDDESGMVNKSRYITVINDAPEVLLSGDTLDVVKNANDTLNLKQVFSDKNDDVVSYTWSGNSAQLGMALYEDTLLVITPSADYTGQETVTFTAEDSEGLSASTDLMVWVSETGTTDIPREFALSQNYPNPFNPVTGIDYSLPESGDVTLSVFDLNGRCVKTLVDSHHEAGVYRAVWNGRDDRGISLGSGVYIFHLCSGDRTASRKTLLMK